jgi:hypothetical protein
VCPIDLALYSDVQLHYTATPLFTGAAVDPLPGGRHYLLRGERARAVAPSAPLTPTSQQRGARAAGYGMGTSVAAEMQFRPPGYRSAHSALTAIEREIASMGEEEEGKAGFHIPAIRALAHLFNAFGPDADPIPIIARWRRAVLTLGRRDASYIEAEQRGLFRFAKSLHAREQLRRMATTAALERAAHTLSLLRRRIAS